MCAHQNTSSPPKAPRRGKNAHAERVRPCIPLQTLQHVLSLRNALRGFAKLSSYSCAADTRCARWAFVQDTCKAQPIKQQLSAPSLPPAKWFARIKADNVQQFKIRTSIMYAHIKKISPKPKGQDFIILMCQVSLKSLKRCIKLCWWILTGLQRPSLEFDSMMLKRFSSCFEWKNILLTPERRHWPLHSNPYPYVSIRERTRSVCLACWDFFTLD